MKFLCLFLLASTSLCAITYEDLNRSLNPNPPFSYDLSIRTFPGKKEGVMVTLHGYGSDWRTGEVMAQNPKIQDHIVAFNLPDHGIVQGMRDPHQTSFGTIYDILPALYVMKRVVIDGGAERLSLYGFSAGGATLINSLVALNSDQDLQSVGIGDAEKKKIIAALEKGTMILDVPLKSIDEIVDLRGATNELLVLKERYRKNGMVPIEQLEQLYPMSLNIVVHFQVPDRAVMNRDDDLYIERLKRGNRNGKTQVIIGSDGGHISYHQSLWDQIQIRQH